jgi:hypothetical protein
VGDIINCWREGNNGGIQINKNFIADSLLFADDEVIITKTDAELQCAVNDLQMTASESDISLLVKSNLKQHLYQ